MIKSFKLRFDDEHVRIVLESFDGPGVDLRGERARAAFDEAKPMTAHIASRQRSMKIRSLSADVGKERVILTFDIEGARPAVLRIDAPETAELFSLAAPLLELLEREALAAIARRPSKRKSGEGSDLD